MPSSTSGISAIPQSFSALKNCSISERKIYENSFHTGKIDKSVPPNPFRLQHLLSVRFLVLVLTVSAVQRLEISLKTASLHPVQVAHSAQHGSGQHAGVAQGTVSVAVSLVVPYIYFFRKKSIPKLFLLSEDFFCIKSTWYLSSSETTDLLIF